MDLPSGTVTFLFTDVEGSTRLWQEHPADMAVALSRHDEIVRSAADAHHGYAFSTAGDAFAVAFDGCHGGVTAAIDIQRALQIEAKLGTYKAGVTTSEEPASRLMRNQAGLHES